MEIVMVVVVLMMTNTGVWSDESDLQLDPVLDPTETDTVTIKESVTEGNGIELEDSLEGGEEEGDNVALEDHNQPDVTNSGLEDISTEYQENSTHTSFHDLEIMQEILEESKDIDEVVEYEGTTLLAMEGKYENISKDTTTPMTDIYDTDDEMEVNRQVTDNSKDGPTETTSAIPTPLPSPPSPSLIDCLQTVNSSSSISPPSQGTITCSCYGGNRTFKWSCLPSLPPSLPALLFTNCSSLVLDLSLPPASPPSSLTVLPSVSSLLLLLAHWQPHSLNLQGVQDVQVILADNKVVVEEAVGVALTPLVLGLGGVVVLLLLLLLLLLLWVRQLRARLEDGDGQKKVSRAESWRYESSIYVNPPQAGGVPGGGVAARARPVYVAPPLPPQELAVPPSPPEDPSTWCRVPESGSSTPLLRTRGQFGVRGVDVVRTSLQTRGESPCTPPAYPRNRARRQNTNIRPGSSLSDSGSECETLERHCTPTLPSR